MALSDTKMDAYTHSTLMHTRPCPQTTQPCPHTQHPHSPTGYTPTHRPAALHTPCPTPLRALPPCLPAHTVIWAPYRAAVSHSSSDRPGPQGLCYRRSTVTLGLGRGKVLRGYLSPRAWAPMEGVPLWGLAEDVAGDRLAAGQPGGGSGPKQGPGDLGWRVLNPYQDQVAFSLSQAPPKDPD